MAVSESPTIFHYDLDAGRYPQMVVEYWLREWSHEWNIQRFNQIEFRREPEEEEGEKTDERN